MDIILWRHAEAEDFNPNESGDLARRLTAKGRGQAQAMAKWLRRHLPGEVAVRTSPARRCIETVEALNIESDLCPDIAPDCGVALHLRVIEQTHQKKGGGLLLVGHQPTLGEVAATLMTGHTAPWSIKKGAVWWLRTDAPGKNTAELVVALPPRLL